MSERILQNYLDEIVESFQSYKILAEKALAQISDEDFFRQIDAESNSLAIIVKHIGGNLRSRWSDFLTTDGEKPDRHRDAEFSTASDSRAKIMEIWETGWQTAIESLTSLAVEDLPKIVKIRGEAFGVTKAVNRSLTHTVSHIGEIIFLAKHLRSSDWQTLSIPRNKSAEFNEFLAAKNDTGNYLEKAQEFVEKDKR